MNYKRGIRIEFEGADIAPIIDLRVSFDVSKSGGEGLNKGIITIYNLRPTSRAALLIARPKENLDDEPVIKVRLFAGYEGNLKPLVTGDILLSKSTKKGTEWITEIEVWAGLTAATKATVVEHWEGKTSAKSIVDKLLAPLSIAINYTASALSQLEGQSYIDFAESGMSIAVTNRFLRRYDLAFTIDEDGSGLVYKEDEAVDPDASQSPTNVFNKDNGLIGSPIITRTGVDFVSLLRPEIKIFQKIFVQARTLSETLQKEENLINEYVVKSIRHYGDTHNDEWFSEITSTYADIIV